VRLGREADWDGHSVNSARPAGPARGADPAIGRTGHPDLIVDRGTLLVLPNAVYSTRSARELGERGFTGRLGR
jgi:hypothetical protein